MCGRYLFDPRTGELSDYYQELVTIAKEQNKKIAVDEVFPSNQVVTLIADDSEPLYLAGFYRNHSTASGSEDESIILTTKPNATIAPIHDRMPVLLSKADVLPWITDVTFARNYLLQTMPDIHPQPVS